MNDFVTNLNKEKKVNIVVFSFTNIIGSFFFSPPVK